jgi:very-short-patch-repair endonuclease
MQKYDAQRNPSVDRAIANLARKQHGVFTRAQVISLGATRGVVAHRLRTGEWDAPYMGVYRDAAAPRTWRQGVLAACLSWDAVASHRAAAPLIPLIGFEFGPIDLIVPRSRTRRDPRVTIHRTPLLPTDVTTRHGIPTTTAMRTIIDLAAITHPDVLEQAFDDALRRKLFRLERMSERLDAHQFDGSKVLRAFIAERAANPGRSKSPLETELARVLRRGGITGFVQQHQVWDGARLIAEIDLAFPDLKLAVEVDGFAFHSSRRDWARDLARSNDLVGLGWTILRFTKEDLRARPAMVVALVRTELAARNSG